MYISVHYRVSYMKYPSDLWPGQLPGPILQFTDFPSLCVCSESSVTNLIGSGLNLLCLKNHSKPECHWTGPEVAVLGADPKERGLWGRECATSDNDDDNVIK